MRFLWTSLLSLFALALAGAGVVAQGEASPTPDPATAVDMPAVDFIDESGNPLATFTVTHVERDWQTSEQFFAPQPGNEYVRVTVSVESRVARGSTTIDPYQFLLQDVDGFVSQAVVIPSQEALESGDFAAMSGILDLPGGETGQISLVFEMLKGAELEAIYYTPDTYTRLLTIAEFDQ